MEKNENRRSLEFIEKEPGEYNIKNRKDVIIGSVIFNDTINSWVFLPIEDYFYNGTYLAIILSKLNELNDFWRDKK